VRDPLTHVWQPQPAAVHRQVAISPVNLEVVREGMMDCDASGGHGVGCGGRRAVRDRRQDRYRSGSRIKQGARYDESRLARKLRDHACSSRMRRPTPKIAIAVMVENAPWRLDRGTDRAPRCSITT